MGVHLRYKQVASAEAQGSFINLTPANVTVNYCLDADAFPGCDSGYPVIVSVSYNFVWCWLDSTQPYRAHTLGSNDGAMMEITENPSTHYGPSEVIFIHSEAQVSVSESIHILRLFDPLEMVK